MTNISWWPFLYCPVFKDDQEPYYIMVNYQFLVSLTNNDFVNLLHSNIKYINKQISWASAKDGVLP